MPTPAATLPERTEPGLLTPPLPRTAGATEETAALQRAPWFAALTPTLRQTILARARVQRLPAGAMVSWRGSATGRWFGVARGVVRLGAPLPDGRDFTLDFLGPGQWFGDIEAVDGRPSELDAMCQVPTTLLTMSGPDLSLLMSSHPELRDALLRLNCQRLRHLLHRFEEQQTLPLAQRLARQVLRLARRFGRLHARGLSVELGVSQADLAAMVGASRQRINQAWRQMQQLDMVERTSSRLVVRDMTALAALAEGRQLPGTTAPGRGGQPAGTTACAHAA